MRVNASEAQWAMDAHECRRLAGVRHMPRAAKQLLARLGTRIRAAIEAEDKRRRRKRKAKAARGLFGRAA